MPFPQKNVTVAAESFGYKIFSGLVKVLFPCVWALCPWLCMQVTVPVRVTVSGHSPVF